MADDSAPEESGTSEEQEPEDEHRLENAEPAQQPEDAGGLAVEAVDEAAPESAGEGEDDEFDMGEELEELQEMLDGVDGEDVAVLGCVLVTKQEYENPEDEDVTGFRWRVLNDDLQGYDDVRDVLEAVGEFNESLEMIEVELGTPGHPLEALFGGDA